MNKVIEYTIKDSSLGNVLIAQSEVGICAILMDDHSATLIEDLQNRFPDSTISQNDPKLSSVALRLLEYIENPSLSIELTLDIRGSDFQKRVWTVLRKIPVGKTASYTAIAKKLNNSNAVRAVASACAANALAVVIPCHRVVRSDGKLSGYRWGIERKQKLLELEGAYASAPQ